jgi:hypothetical protein
VLGRCSNTVISHRSASHTRDVSAQKYNYFAPKINNPMNVHWHLEECLREWHDNFAFTPFFSVKMRVTAGLKFLADQLMQDSQPATRHAPTWDGWPTQSLYALDLRGEPWRLGFCEDVWDYFPLKPGLRGVVWSRESGYECTGDKSDHSDPETESEYQELFVERQRRLERNIETAVALMRSAKVCDAGSE